MRSAIPSPNTFDHGRGWKALRLSATFNEGGHWAPIVNALLVTALL